MSGAPSSTRVPELDGVRGVACLLVLLYHVVYMRAPTNETAALLRTTYVGVDLFFVLSGFLLGGILMDNRSSPNLLPVFYVRRGFRLLPLYFAWLALFVVARAALAGDPNADWLIAKPLPLWSYATYTQNFVMAAGGAMGPHFLGVTWSLAVEEQFYLLLPAVVLVVRPRWLPWIALAFALSAPMLRTGVIALKWDRLAAYVLLPGRWDGLFMGVLAAWLVRRPWWRPDRARPWLYAVLVPSAAACVWLWHAAPYMLSTPMLTWGYSAHNLAFTALVLLAVSGAWWAPLTRAVPLVWLGRVSYGVYLFHQGVAGLVFLAFGHPNPSLLTEEGAALTALGMGLTLAMAELSFRYYERPLQGIGHRWRYRPPITPAPSRRP